MKLPILATLIGTTLLPLVSTTVNAADTFYVTPYLGYSFSNSITDEDGVKISTEDGLHYAVGLETNMGSGRVGLFISHQPNEFDNIEGDGSFTYVHFQSALHYDTFTRADTYFGASIGTTIIDADWASNDLELSGSIFGGLSYQLDSNVKIALEGRWLGNLIDSNTTAICQLPTGNQSCKIRIDSKWLGQFQTNIGLTFSF